MTSNLTPFEFSMRHLKSIGKNCILYLVNISQFAKWSEQNGQSVAEQKNWIELRAKEKLKKNNSSSFSCPLIFRYCSIDQKIGLNVSKL